MKIRILSIILLLVLLLTACQSGGYSYNGLPSISLQLKEEINTALHEQYGKDIKSIRWEDNGYYNANIRYYGTYDGYSILFQEGALPAVESKDIAGYVFEHYMYFSLHAYADGVFIDLKEAYQEGLVDSSDIAVVAKLHKECNDIVFGRDST